MVDKSLQTRKEERQHLSSAVWKMYILIYIYMYAFFCAGCSSQLPCTTRDVTGSLHSYQVAEEVLVSPRKRGFMFSCKLHKEHNRSKTCGKQVPHNTSPLHSPESLWLPRGRPWQQQKSHSLLTLETQWPTSTLGEINHPLAVLLMTQPESTYFIAEDERDK